MTTIASFPHVYFCNHDDEPPLALTKQSFTPKPWYFPNQVVLDCVQSIFAAQSRFKPSRYYLILDSTQAYIKPQWWTQPKTHKDVCCWLLTPSPLQPYTVQSLCLCLWLFMENIQKNNVSTSQVFNIADFWFGCWLIFGWWGIGDIILYIYTLNASEYPKVVQCFSGIVVSYFFVSLMVA